MAKTKITIPNAWVPRAYQLPLWTYFERGGKHGVAVWHRRGGKDSLALNWTAVAAHTRIGVYWHMLPTQKQGRKVIWDGIDKQGRRMIDQVFPEAIRKSTNSQEMRIELKCGSIWQVVGSDNYDSLVGANPVGVVHSEFSVANPAARRFLSPILKENEGWELYIYTPRGKNHGHTLFQMAKKNLKWYAEILTLEDTQAYPVSIIDDERAEGMDEDLVQQEYYCSFDAAVAGAYYGKQITKAKAENRIGAVPWEPKLRVVTAWDIGVDDDTVIWFVQLHGKEVRVIDYYANRNEGFEHYAKVLLDKPYSYEEHLLPHDITVRNMGAEARSRQDILEALLNQRVTAVPRQSVEDGIQAVRTLLPRMYFDEDKTEVGYEALALYRSEFDEKSGLYKPVHDWTSHTADSMRTLAMGLREIRPSQRRQASATTAYDEVGFGLGQPNRQEVAVDDHDYF
jgi:hypothetical protein